jgi:hypothetical protein
MKDNEREFNQSINQSIPMIIDREQGADEHTHE